MYASKLTHILELFTFVHTATHLSHHTVPPDHLFRETAVDVIDVLLQNRPRISFELLHSLQPPVGDEQAARFAVVGQHLQRVGGHASANTDATS